MIGYDNISVNHQMLLHLPFTEGIGTITHDVAKPHHLLTQHDPGGGSFTWDNVASGHPYLEFTSIGFGAADGVYLDCSNANTADLDFTSEDYSIVFWINHHAVGNLKPKIVIGRYEIDNAVQANNKGWEVYIETNAGVDYLELRHHHGSIGPWPSPRDGCYSTGWSTGSWDLIGITRHKVAGTSWPQHYKNGVPLAMTYNDLVNGMRDPDSCDTSDLVIGSRFSKDMDWLDGYLSRLRVCGEELSASDMKFIFETERGWFGV